MADFEDLGLSKDEGGSVDASECSGSARWQQFLRQWKSPIAFGPFAVLVFVIVKFPEFPDRLFLPLAFTTVLWAVAVVGYALYLKYQD